MRLCRNEENKENNYCITCKYNYSVFRENGEDFKICYDEPIKNEEPKTDIITYDDPKTDIISYDEPKPDIISEKVSDRLTQRISDKISEITNSTNEIFLDLTTEIYENENIDSTKKIKEEISEEITNIS